MIKVLTAFIEIQQKIILGQSLLIIELKKEIEEFRKALDDD